ncbi:BrnA antitoxin family protein [Gloeocapsa sp. PCC 73106]|uniref:BrnA antitoxin family protein n=1 Tax=Gloeocapsa sp. PCC 73106 TaxID=102232 RepID=UPI00069811A1|nr:BrnA antitoxin family protein [Gloeocapsa sp. PCC 73106]
MNETGTDWDRLHRMSEAEIHAAISGDPDIIPTNEAFWENAELVMPQRRPTITLSLDADVLAWLRNQGDDYQNRINAILRSYINAQDDGVN